jgi:hypothetical protein
MTEMKTVMDMYFLKDLEIMAETPLKPATDRNIILSGWNDLVEFVMNT